MTRLIQKYILKINKAAGVEITLLDDGTHEINTVVAFVHKDKIHHNTITSIRGIEKLPSVIKNEIPLYLTINGKGVLNKIVTGGEQETITPEQVLPNANSKDYYIESTKGDSCNIVSMARKASIDPIINNLTARGYEVLGFSLGFHHIEKIIDFVVFENDILLQTTNFRISYNSKRSIQSFENISHLNGSINAEYLVAGQYFKANQLLAFGTAVAAISDDISTDPVIVNDTITKARVEYKRSRFFKSALWTSLSFILILLLINFFIYNHYFSRNQQMETQKSFSAIESIKTDSMKQSVRKAESFLAGSRWDKQSVASFLADRIAGMVPSSVTLNMMNIYPSGTEGSGFKNDTILVTGTSDDAMLVNRFTNNIKSINHVKKASITNYQYKREMETGIFQIEIVTQ